MNTKILLALIATLLLAFHYVQIQTSEETQLEQYGDFNFWAGQWYCNAKMSCTQGTSNMIRTNFNNPQTLTQYMAQIVSSYGAFDQVYSVDFNNGNLYRPTYPSYSCGWNSNNYAIKCIRQ